MDDPEPTHLCLCGVTRRATWSPVFGAYLCQQCLWAKTDALLKEPVTTLPVRP